MAYCVSLYNSLLFVTLKGILLSTLKQHITYHTKMAHNVSEKSSLLFVTLDEYIAYRTKLSYCLSDYKGLLFVTINGALLIILN